MLFHSTHSLHGFFLAKKHIQNDKKHTLGMSF
jgi:hypothetical protein